ncbi:hypothetical protein BN1723_013015 [Verticillium longisporum]|uniref:Zn(2)-C6 fungal-type domain-containing protein n=2 Tax=Verticillium longisporum TaxID=100787 RepID=A0A0G4LP85_VERLO|nr:hypothetical protein BN1723_013015 [Verticillium longisporum]
MAGFSATNSRNLGNGSVRGASGTSNDSPTSVISNASSSRKRGQPASGTSPREEPSLEPENRRKSKKISRACDFCKAKKLKCSGTLPCDGCTKRQLSCVYDATYRRGRPPTPQPRPEVAPREPGSLPEAIERLISRNSESTHPSFHGSHEGVRNGDGNVSTSRASPELESAEIEGQYLDPTSSLTFLHRAWKRLSSQKDTAGIAPQVSNNAEYHQSMISAGDKPFAVHAGDMLVIPGHATAMEMLQYYFDVCVVTYRCLHQGYVTRWFTAVLANRHANLPLYYGIGHAKAAVVLNILAIVTLRQIQINDVASLTADGGFVVLQRSDSLFCAATNLTDNEVGRPSLDSVQARLLQVLYLLQSARMNQAWYIFGSTLPIVSALGLHRRPGGKRGTSGPRPTNFDYIASQCRKRTFWVAYTIDKYLAVVFGRPRLYHDDDIDQDFPDEVNDEDMTPQGRAAHEPKMDCQVDSLICHAKLAQLIDRVSREVYSIKKTSKQERLESAHKFSHELHQWRESLPYHLGTLRPMSLIPSFRRQATALKLACCHAIMHVNRPFILGTPGNSGEGQPTPLEDSVAECINAAKTALETVDTMATDGTLFHALWWTPYVTFLCSSRGDNHGLRPLIELAERCQNNLARATAPDSPSRRYSVIIEELRQEAQRQLERAPRQAQPAADAHPQQPEQYPSRNTGPVAVMANVGELNTDEQAGQQIFVSEGDAGFGSVDLLDGWQTTDWLDLDSSAFGPFPGFEGSPILWTDNPPPPIG